MLVNIIKIGLPLVVMGTMFTQGLRLKLGGGLATFKDRPLVMLRSLVVVLVLVPIAALAIILLLKPSPGTVVGLAILAASPAATFQLRNIYKKGGSPAYLRRPAPESRAPRDHHRAGSSIPLIRSAGFPS